MYPALPDQGCLFKCVKVALTVLILLIQVDAIYGCALVSKAHETSLLLNIK